MMIRRSIAVANVNGIVQVCNKAHSKWLARPCSSNKMCWIWTRRSLSSFSSSASSSDGQVSAAAQKAQALWNEQVRGIM